MGRSLLDILNEQNFNLLGNQNILFSDDVQGTGQEYYLETYGDLINVNNFSNRLIESERVIDIARRIYSDRRELNLNSPVNPDEFSVNRSDVSVIQSDELDEIAEPKLLNDVQYNKYSDLEFAQFIVPTQFPRYTNQQTYQDYIDELLTQRREFSLEDIFLGRFDREDTRLGEIGVEGLQGVLNDNFNANLRRKTLGKINLDGFSLLRGEPLFRKDFSITRPTGTLNRAADYLRDLQGVNIPFSPIPDDFFNLHRERSGSFGRYTYENDNRTDSERLVELAKYTGKGIIKKWETDSKLNIYGVSTNSRKINTSGRQYFQDMTTSAYLQSISFNTDAITGIIGKSYYETFGINSITVTRNVNVEVEISNERYFALTDDIPEDEIVFSPFYSGGNPFPVKSMLYRQKELFDKNYIKDEAFLNQFAKEFKFRGPNGFERMSYADSTPATGDFEMDDGYQVKKGEFFRVWTKSRGYNRLSRTLRHRSLDNGETRTVLKDNGLINFAPTYRNSSGEFIKRYMFSIENLAYADNLADLPDCEKGPGDPITGHRGRIMWFPPYNLKIDESVQAQYSKVNFIGRPEPILSYKETSRTANLNFTMIVDHPDIVHVKIEKNRAFWERYFKGDKLTLEDPQIQNYLKNRLSDKEIDQIRRRQAISTPVKKTVDGDVISQTQADNKKQSQISQKADDGEYGEKILSVYFANEVTVVPRPLSRDSLYGTKKLSDITKGNIGYEDGGRSAQLTQAARTIDGVTVSTVGGLSYDGTSSNGVTFNGNAQYTFLNGIKRLPVTTRTLASGLKCPDGYSDNNNLGLNEDFYFNFEDIIKEKMEGLDKVRVRIIGNASGATVKRITNKKLARKRAENTRDWFQKYVINRKAQIGFDTEILEVIVQSKADQEDVDKLNEYNSLIAQGRPNLAANIVFCSECDQPDESSCKKTRRTDIYIESVDDDEQPIGDPDPIIEQTLPEITVSADGTPDPDQNNPLPNNDVELPPIDPAIIDKLIYTECDFFEYLEINKPNVFETISDRIKYFHPVYHSMTPQGFNSRLTFLQQCMREGDSVGNDGVNNYRNLAFGRMPVCILRIGDFYHTRVIFESLSIGYSKQMQWDMNPEGIGIQPMYCDISMKLTMLGGSSLSGPINRLQNALSYNYYANTEMYDARSDSIVFSNEDGTESTLDVPDGGRIVDGIRLSSFNTWNESIENKKLAKLRAESRVTLQDVQINQTTGELEFSPLTNQRAQELGRAPALIQYKDQLGLPLTKDERKLLNMFNFQRDAIDLLPVSDSQKEIMKTSLTNAFYNGNEELTKRLKDAIVRADVSDLFSTFNQVLGQTVPNSVPTNAINKYIDYIIKKKVEFIDLF